jgi:hypothetical protein
MGQTYSESCTNLTNADCVDFGNHSVLVNLIKGERVLPVTFVTLLTSLFEAVGLGG